MTVLFLQLDVTPQDTLPYILDIYACNMIHPNMASNTHSFDWTAKVASCQIAVDYDT